ncbi:50S ribosomal protein L32 [Candidatus Uhrbacteria bacterium RIFCSPLOWO2_01_FULL_53_9]|uniref:Large ribosomal subunit protein bL32 n=3 Tax=Candidatus Uhriibacteriota TaxID=1752732 RepID=A0A1F7UYD3_9BACT|nr:MAG: 50S ribosomal protein L32 [Candidatus Uhrbacteria bacterium RIFCSPHIGHO2_02_FULL_53_13]OGL82768.1 MAG: 50S ribosomal protein L32 [Candidatus Uhrbacteria bacterium RIFCSPLOWO2_01_FULL_53_9]OGL90390.1 MAG: 50S ribosomal protein L32 [Candidatus Uhrbacteria bacterium RIFCSPLOWO2_02_FULL_53_10]
MTVPSHRQSSSRTRRGRSHLALKKMNLATCKACKAPVEPHRVCAECGNYDGKAVK